MINRLINIFSTAVAVVLTLAASAFVFVLIVPVDVLRNWAIKSDKDAYNIGETAYMQVGYEKIRRAKSTSFYYVECKRSTGGYSRYAVTQVKSDNPPGKRTITLPVVIPETVRSTALPATCRFTISSTYSVFSFRDHHEEQHSNEFTVKE